ncbi:uncharacterized protein LOC143147879 [Ptiloglossa arizonensis]|uniref:uncharacterized protein LOC143147879 n=1 Tax=Ptiloglossa arizonensis TaxID=3350558 RepID=UPI003FA0E2BF
MSSVHAGCVPQDRQPWIRKDSRWPGADDRKKASTEMRISGPSLVRRLGESAWGKNYRAKHCSVEVLGCPVTKRGLRREWTMLRIDFLFRDTGCDESSISPHVNFHVLDKPDLKTERPSGTSGRSKWYKSLCATKSKGQVSLSLEEERL